MTEDDLKAIEARANAATPGPWTIGDGSVVVLVSGKTGGVHLSHIEVRHG